MYYNKNYEKIHKNGSLKFITIIGVDVIYTKIFSKIKNTRY